MASTAVALVTGSTDGLGRRIAEHLGATGTHLLVHGRDPARGRDVVRSVTDLGGTATYYQADFADVDDVRTLALAIASDHERLDLIINNAGIAQVDGPQQRNQDGHELHFVVNYLSPFLLTHELRRLLHAGSRVVNVTSAAQTAINFDDVMMDDGYSGHRAYGQSKLAQVMHAFDLASELEPVGVRVNSVHPANFMDTGPVRAAGITPTNTVDVGARHVLSLAAGGTHERVSGRYFDEAHEARAHAQAYDTRARQRLRALTWKLLGING